MGGCFLESTHRTTTKFAWQLVGECVLFEVKVISVISFTANVDQKTAEKVFAKVGYIF